MKDRLRRIKELESVNFSKNLTRAMGEAAAAARAKLHDAGLAAHDQKDGNSPIISKSSPRRTS